jgi:hypothetical protein
MARPRGPWLALALLASVVPFGAAVARPPAVSSPTIPMRDGVRLAADVILPAGAARTKVPAILVMTPYGRATRLSATGVRAFAGAGLAVVLVDMRGSGASQGHVLSIFSNDERRDIGGILAWIARQPWSDGRVVCTGVSYDGNLAALALAAPGRTLAAVAPRFIDFDTYRDLAVPGGVRDEMLLHGWGALTDAQNLAQPCVVSAADCGAANLEPVGGDADRSALRKALLDHQRNWRPYPDTRGYAFDDDVTPSGADLREGFLSSQLPALNASPAPVELWGSWFDASTADSALAWYRAAPHAQMEVYLGAWVHGGGARVDPFIKDSAEDEPGAPAPARTFLDFVRRALARRRATARIIHYYTAGAAVWRATPVWPPANVAPARWYFAPGGALSRDAPRTAAGADRYVVDFTSTTGATNRWTTQLGGGPVDYGDRAGPDRKLLTYTSAPLARDIEVTGAPVATVRLASTHPDGAVFVYLEAVAPDGRSTYLTEGELRLPLRGPASAANAPPGVRASFLRADMAPLTPGLVIEIGVPLHAVSAVVPAGYRLRIAIGGADADTFGRYPADGDPTYVIHRSTDEPSFVDLPQAEWTGGAAARR